MLTRLWAILRSLYLIGIVGYAIWATPWMPMTVARTFDEQYARCANALAPLQRATWLAVGWIALEVVVGWMIVWRNSHADRSELKKALKEAKAGQTLPPEGPPSAP
jgi:hypothetical protein